MSDSFNIFPDTKTEVFSSILEYYSSMNFPTEPMKTALSEYVNQVHTTLGKSVMSSTVDIFKDVLLSADIANVARDILEDFNKYIIVSLDVDLNELCSIANSCGSILASLPASNESESSNDYVSFTKSAAKEWDISETIAIPIGNNRVRMKTSDFISLLSAIITVLAFVIPFIYGRIDTASTNHYEQQRIEIEQEQNQLLSEFLSSIDSTTSSQSESVEDLKKSVQALHSEFVELQDTLQSLQSFASEHPESPDTLPKIGDNNLGQQQNLLAK